MRTYHHNDLDGRCAAAVVFSVADKTMKFIELDYHNEVDIDAIKKNEKIIIVDFSFKPEVMEKILEKTKDITWIDHHKTADEYVYSQPIEGLRITENKKFAACELTWMYYYQNFPLPEAVKLIGDRDKWAWNYGEKTLLFNLGMEIYPQDPTDANWGKLLHNDIALIDEISNAGKTCVRYRDAVCLDYRNAYGFEALFEGRKCYAQGLYMFGSEAFGDKINTYPICISFEFTGDKWIVGLYSTTIDVGEIAKKYGGGGHKGASGFVTQSLPFQKIK